jgi:hypothetical protein
VATNLPQHLGHQRTAQLSVGKRFVGSFDSQVARLKGGTKEKKEKKKKDDNAKQKRAPMKRITR